MLTTPELSSHAWRSACDAAAWRAADGNERDCTRGEMVADLADRLYVLDHGEPIAEGNPDAVLKDPRVVTAYLGASTLHEPVAVR